ncbi:hypothetical protein KCU71_g592, partial [Aureobasidium melanogenum]
MGEKGSEGDTRLINPEISIVQDVEEDLEDYSRLVKIGRFGEASVFFREVLHRSLNHFAVLAEHCNALIEQGDFLNAELILSHSIGRQSRCARRSERFEPDELQLLRLLLAYVSIHNEHDQQEEEVALEQARWSHTLLEIQGPSKVTDVQRQILLTRLRIHVVAQADSEVALEELRLPWSPRQLFPGETMTISDDYLAWFEVLLAQHPWDANIILQHLSELRVPSLYHQDYQIISRMIRSTVGSGPNAGSQLFARMMLLGTLFEAATSRTWSNFHRSFSRTEMSRIWNSPEIEELMHEIEEVLQQHSKDDEVSGTRPYKWLELLIIDHETLRDTRVEAARRTVYKALSRLDSIEKFTMGFEVHDHYLALEILYRHYIFTPERDLRSVVLDKLAQYTAHFGDIPECRSMQMAIANGELLVPRVRSKKGFISQVLQIRIVIPVSRNL